MDDYKPVESRETLSDYAPFRKVIGTDDARQGVTGHGVRYVLGISLVLSLVALYFAWSYLG